MLAQILQHPSCEPRAGRGTAARIPAALSNIVGLTEPGSGLRHRRGSGLPLARLHLDLTTDDAATVLAIIAGPDRTDPYSRSAPRGALGGNALASTAWYPERSLDISHFGLAGLCGRPGGRDRQKFGQSKKAIGRVPRRP